MATKKQKREAALARRERWLEEVRLSGLKAQKEDQERRKKKLQNDQKGETKKVAVDG